MMIAVGSSTDMDMRGLVERIDQRLEALGMSASEASQQATGSKDTIRNWKRAAATGAKTGATIKTLEPVARILKTNVQWLLANEGPIDSSNSIDGLTGEVPLSDRRVVFGGTVRAGEFLPVEDDFNQDAGDHMVPLGVAAHPGYPGIPQTAWRVSGNSMTEAGIHDGMWVVGMSYAEWIDKIGELGNGNLVVVERTRNGGSERELTVKEVQFSREGMRLVPRSEDKKYREFFVPFDEAADSDRETISVLAVVLWFGRDVDPRSAARRAALSP